MLSSPNTNRKIVYEYADEMKKYLINSFKDSGKVHSLTTDDAEFLDELLNNKLEEFQLKTMSITTDGTAVMTSMCTKINLLQQKCQLHGVNLAIKDIFYKPINKKMSVLEIFSNDTPDLLKQFDFMDDVEEIELQEALLPLHSV